MTATIKPPDQEERPRRRPVRITWMETLGFSDTQSTWTDSPSRPVPGQQSRVAPVRTGRHEASPDPLAGWKPEEFGGRLIGGNVRWGLVVGMAALIIGLVWFGMWLYQRPEAEAAATASEVVAQAQSLQGELAVLEELNDQLDSLNDNPDTSELFAVENEARALFNMSGELGSSSMGIRSQATDAAGTALDAVHLLSDAYAYRSALVPVLLAPALETDPELIELDEAARSFSEWQSHFDDIRTALPSGVLPEVTDQLDAVSRSLSRSLNEYVDALGEDDMAAASGVIRDLSDALSEVESTLVVAVRELQGTVTTQVEDARRSLELLLG